MERNVITAQTKAGILRELLENQVPAAELSERYHVNINSIYNWRKQLFESAVDIFSNKHEKTSQKDQLRDKDTLIAELAQDNIAPKKKPNGMMQRSRIASWCRSLRSMRVGQERDPRGANVAAPQAKAGVSNTRNVYPLKTRS